MTTRVSIAVSLLLLLLWGSVAVCGQDAYTVRFNESDLFVDENLDYDVVELEGCRTIDEVGAPQLPLLVTYVAIPQGVTVVGVEVLRTDAVDIPGYYEIFPVQEPQPIGSSPRDFVKPDPAIYHSSDPYPGKMVEFVHEADLAGQNLAVVAISPVQYIGAEGRLILNREIEFELQYEPTDREATVPNLAEHNRKKYEENLKEMVINPNDVSLPVRGGDPVPMGIPPDSKEYVIICYTSYSSQAQPLVDWKTKKGVPARLVTLSDIQSWYGGSGSTQIRSFVQDAHNSWGAIYFLIVGDAGRVSLPTKYISGMGTIPGDTYYGDYDNDWVTEVHVGRAPATSTTQVTTFVNKVIEYETDPVTNDYPLKCGFFAFDPDYSTRCETFAEEVINQYVPGRFSVTRVYDSYGGNHESAAKAAIEGGLNFAWHLDHGDCDIIGFGAYWHGWYMNTGEVDALNNDYEMVNFYSLSCHSAAIDECSSIAEHFTVYNDYEAGISYTGNTRYGWYQYGNCGAYSGVYVKAFAKSILYEEHYPLGEAFTDHKNDNPPGSSEYMQYCYYELILCGDPEMPLWLYQPEDMTVTHATFISMGEQDFTVTVKDGASGIQGARVCLMKGDEVYAVGTTNYSGNVTLTINPTTAGTMDVTVTAHDYIPYEGTCEVGGIPDVTVTLDPDATVVPRGGTLGYTVAVTNHGGTSVSFDYWTDIILWTGKPYNGNPVFGPLSVSLNPGQTRQGHISHKVPNNAPLETYSCCGRIGSHPDNVWDEDCFQFTVVSGANGAVENTSWEAVEYTF